MKKIRSFIRDHKAGCLVAAGVFSLLIASLQSWFYHASLFEQPYLPQNLLYRFFLMLENGFKAFTFEAKISMQDVVRYMEGDLTPGQYLVSFLYIIAFFAAPLITATAIFSALQFVVGNELNALTGKRKEKYLIVGYSGEADAFIKNLQSLDHRRHQIVVLTREELTDSQKSFLQSKHILIKNFSRLEMNGGEADERINARYLSLRYVSRILFLEKSAAENFTNYIFFSQLWKNCLEKKLLPAGQRLDVYCLCEAGEIERLIWNYQDHLAVPKPYLHLFSTSSLRVRALLEQAPLYAFNQSTGTQNVHLLLIGFGDMGQKFLREALNQAVLDADSRIIVDIVDRDAQSAAWALGAMFGSCYDPDSRSLHLSDGELDGELEIRLYTLDIRNNALSTLLRQLTAQEPITYAALCLPQTEQEVFCMTELENFFTAISRENVPIAVRLDTCSAVTSYLNDDKDSHRNITVLPAVQDVITFAHICAGEDEQSAERAHNLYAGAEAGRTHADIRENINELLFKQESSYYQVYHREAKRMIFQRLSPEEQQTARGEVLRLCERMELLEKEPQRYDAVIRDCNAMIFASPLLQRLGAIEHRRWSYYMIAAGWSAISFQEASGIPKKERIKKKVNPNLLSWRELCKQNPSVLAYDLLPWKDVL